MRPNQFRFKIGGLFSSNHCPVRIMGSGAPPTRETVKVFALMKPFGVRPTIEGTSFADTGLVARRRESKFRIKLLGGKNA